VEDVCAAFDSFVVGTLGGQFWNYYEGKRGTGIRGFDRRCGKDFVLLGLGTDGCLNVVPGFEGVIRGS
jgi:hypothetical protein